MTTTPTHAPPAQGRRTVLIIVGALFGLVSLVLFAIGGFGLWAQQQRDNGYFTAGPERVTTSSYALLSPSLDIGGAGPDAFYTDDFLGEVRIDLASKNGTPVFVGIGPAAEVATYLEGVEHDEVADFDVDPFKLSTTARAGDKPATAPAEQTFWVASATDGSLDWTATGGDWSVVVMNADGSPNVDAELSVGGTLPAVEGITAGSLVGAVLMLIIAAAFIVPAVAGPRRAAERARVT